MKKLEDALTQLNINYSSETIEKFAKYMEMILEWNQHVNLTAITEKEEFVQKHFVDSVLCAGRKEIENANNIIDVGTGAGFPGVPLALLYPEKEFILMDSLNKRLKIISEIAEKLEINNIKALHARAEELGHNKEHREHYDLCVSRAVANLSTLSEYCLPLVRKGGWFYAYKGPDADNEIKEAGQAPNILGGKLQEVFHPELLGFELDHNILCIEKIKNTPAKYPRKAGTPAKEPLK